jgi:hypothetical protein
LAFLQNKTDVLNHMSKHADLVKPKFEVAFRALDSLSSEIGSYKKPTGGILYFLQYKQAYCLKGL